MRASIRNDIKNNVDNIGSVIIQKIRDDVEHHIIYDEYHIHDFANQTASDAKSVDIYVNNVCNLYPKAFHIIVTNDIDWRKSMHGTLSHNLSHGGRIERYNSNIIIAMMRSGIEEDDLLCLYLLEELTFNRTLRDIRDRKIIIRSDDDMTTDQHGLPSVAERFYSVYVWPFYNSHTSQSVWLQNYKLFVKRHTEGSRGNLSRYVEPDDEITSEKKRKRIDRFKLTNSHHGGDYFKQKYLKYKQKYLELSEKT